MTTVDLARYKDGELCVESHATESVRYLAISHVWGQTEYRDLPGFKKHPILISQHKWNFLLKELPKLVGSEWFWMDILCVDQRSEDARIAVVDQIPDIFRRSFKTIVIKDGDGFTACCRDAIGICGADNSWRQRLYNHLRDKHIATLISDSWLERLWPLQEAMLSNTLHFTNCEDRDVRVFRFYGEEMSYHRLWDDLWTVSHAWIAYGREKENVSDEFEEHSVRFVNAFLHNGTITRPTLPASATAGRGFGWEMRQHTNSRRKTTKARDFILAIMPQYGWYKKPPDVKDMSFPQIFSDCYKQALQTGAGLDTGADKEVAFVPRLTRGMVEPTTSSEATAEPLQDIPLPETLGDFVKLLGSTASANASKLGLDLGKVQITSIFDGISIGEALELIRTSMDFSSRKWELAYIGELSPFDTLPETRTPAVNIRAYLQAKDEGVNLESWKAQQRRQGMGTRMSSEHVVSECCRTLNSIWAARQYPNHVGDWTEYKRWLLDKNPAGYASTLIYLTTLISCGLGISALSWIRQRVVPVVVALSKYTFLGLVQSGAATLDHAYYSSEYFRGYHAVQRVSDVGTNFDVLAFTGRDCVLTVDFELEEGKVTHEIVGMLPDLVDADSKNWFLERFEAIFPNDGQDAAMTYIRLG